MWTIVWLASFCLAGNSIQFTKTKPITNSFCSSSGSTKTDRRTTVRDQRLPLHSCNSARVARHLLWSVRGFLPFRLRQSNPIGYRKQHHRICEKRNHNKQTTSRSDRATHDAKWDQTFYHGQTILCWMHERSFAGKAWPSSSPAVDWPVWWLATGRGWKMAAESQLDGATAKVHSSWTPIGTFDRIERRRKFIKSIKA